MALSNDTQERLRRLSSSWSDPPLRTPLRTKKEQLSRQETQTVCVRSISRKSRDLDALGSREVIVVMKVGIVVTVAVVVSE